MKAFVIALLLSAAASAHADIVVLPSPQGCKQARVEGNAEVMKACDKLAKGEPVNLACPLQGGCKTTK